MSTESTAVIITQHNSDLHAMPTETLKLELAKSLQITVENFQRMAFIIRELEERGEDLESLRISLLTYLRKIAHGQLAAAAVVRFASRPDLLARVSRLPLPDQEFLAQGGPIDLVVRQGESMTTRKLDPFTLERNQLAQVFDTDKIRSTSEQIALIESKPANTEKTTRKPGSIRVDRERKGLILGRKFFSANEILEALSTISDQVEEAGEMTVINIDSAYAKCIRIQAAKRDTTMRDLVTRCLRACGLLTEN